MDVLGIAYEEFTDAQRKAVVNRHIQYRDGMALVLDRYARKGPKAARAVAKTGRWPELRVFSELRFWNAKFTHVSSYPDATLADLVESSAAERGVKVCIATV
jgi:hypothetical protein